MIKLVKYACSTPDSSGHGSSRQSEEMDQDRAENDIDTIRYPQAPHSNIGIACSAENSIDQEEQHNHYRSAKHDPGIGCSYFNHFGGASHDAQHIAGKERA